MTIKSKHNAVILLIALLLSGTACAQGQPLHFRPTTVVNMPQGSGALAVITAANTGSYATHAPATLPAASGNASASSSGAPFPSAAAQAVWDEQIAATYTTDFNSLAVNVTVPIQASVNEIGPGYLLNGFTNKGYWYQVGVNYNWPYQAGGYDAGFHFIYETFNASGQSIFPLGGGSGLLYMNVSSGNKVLLNLYFNTTTGDVVMYAYDWNTTSSNTMSYSAEGATYFVGNTSRYFSYNGFFTGPMTEQYHVNEYHGTEQPVTYATVPGNYAMQSIIMWSDQWVPTSPNKTTPYPSSCGTPCVHNLSGTQFQSFTYNNATIKADAYEVISGNFPLTVQAPANVELDYGQQDSVVSGQILNGTPSYLYQWYKEAPGSNSYVPISAATANQYALYSSGNALGNYHFSLSVADSASARQNSGVVYSLPSNVLIAPSPSLYVYDSNSYVIDAGQSVTFTFFVYNGVGPFTVNLLIGDNVVATNTVLYNSLSSLTYDASTAGTYAVNIVATDTGSSVPYVFNTSANTLQVNPTPAISISPTSNTIDAGQSVTFTNTITGGTAPFTYAYTVNAASGYSISGNTITFANAGTFNVLESITDSKGVTAYSVNSVVIVNPTPAISISPTSNTIDAGQSVTFTNTITGGTAPFTYQYSPNSMSGVSISGNTITFANAGTFNVLESITDSKGVTADSANSVITVNPTPVITLSPATNSIDAGQSVTFTNTITGGTAPFTYQYSPNSMSGVSISGNTITFANAGTFNVLESITDSKGVTADSANSVITVNPTPVITLSPATNSIDAGQSVTFTNTITGGTAPFTYQYSPNSMSGVSISGNTITFANAGTFNVLESITDSKGVTADSANSVITVNPTPVITLSPATNSIDAGQSVTFTNTITGGTAPFTYQYSPNSMSGVSISGNTITFANAGTFNVLESITDSKGVTADSANSVITVNPTPVITLSPATNSIDAGQSVTFTNTITGGTAPFTYQYSPNSMSGVSISGNTITFANAGTFNVLESITDSKGVTADSANSVITVNPTPVITLSPATNSIDAGQSVTFTNTITGGTAPFTYQYSPNSMSGVSISGNTITFANAGTFNVLESITDSKGVTADSANSVITVNPTPVITLSPATNSIDAGQSVTFTNTITGGTAPFTYQYSPNSMSGVSISGNTITFANAGTFNVLESITDSKGVTADSANSVITVNPTPVITLSPATNSIDAGQSVTFTNTITGGTAPFTYQYSPNSMSGVSISGNTITFANAGTFNVLESITDSKGVTADSANSVITVNPTPVITLSPATNSIDAGQSVTFTNTITGGTAPFTYQYSPNSMSGVSISGNTITFANAGTFNVLESATDAAGHTSKSSNSVVTVITPPTITISPLASEIEDGHAVTFRNTTTGGASPYTFAYEVFQSGVLASAGNYTLGGNTITFTRPGTYNILESAMDSLGGTAYSANSTISVASPEAITLRPLSASTDTGKTVLFSNVTSGGISPYTFTYNVFQYGTAALAANYVINGNSIEFLNPAAQAQAFNVLETVTDLDGIMVSSSNSVITVNPLPSITLSPNSATASSGGTVAFTNITTGGASPLTYAYSVYEYGTVAQSGNYTISENSITFINYGGANATFNVIETVTDGVGVIATSSNSVVKVTPGPRPTTTVPAGGGGSGGGSGGSGGNFKPTIVNSTEGAAECSTILNFTHDNQGDLTVDGRKFNVVENFITPTDAGVSVNGVTYLLSPNTPTDIGTVGFVNYTVELTKLSYLPIIDTVAVQLCGQGASPPVRAAHNVTVSGNVLYGTYNVSLRSGLHANVVGLDLIVQVLSNSTRNETEKVQTGPYGGNANISDYKDLGTFSLTVTPTAAVDITQGYRCGYNTTTLQPFLLEGGTWVKVLQFATYPSECVVVYSVPSNSVAGLFEALPRSSITTAISTTTVMTGATQGSKGGNGTTTIQYIIVAVAVVVLCGILIRRGLIGRESPPLHLPRRGAY